MNHYRAGALWAAILSTLTAAVVAQQTSPAQEPADLKLKVEIIADKTDYTTQEAIGFRALLINEDERSVYIAKSWKNAGGGIAGFNTYTKQISGIPPTTGCSVVADRGFYNESRPAEQILREDFVLLAPGEFVGFHGFLPRCSGFTPGTFQFTAEYSATDWNTPQVATLSSEERVVLTGTLRSAPYVFRVHAPRKANRPKVNVP